MSNRRIKDTYIYRMPEHWLSYFVNADATGYDDEELEAIYAAEAKIARDFEGRDYFVDYMFGAVDPHFAGFNSFSNLGQNCVDIQVIEYEDISAGYIEHIKNIAVAISKQAEEAISIIDNGGDAFHTYMDFRNYIPTYIASGIIPTL